LSGVVGLVAATLAVLVAGVGTLLAWQALLAARRAAAGAAELIAGHRLAEDRRDAERVCAWAVSERETFEKIITRGVVGAAVRNGSATPVYQLELVYHDPDAAWTAVKRIAMVPPTDAPEVYAGFDEDKTEGEPKPDRVNADGTIRLAASADMHLEMRFTDGQGRRWVRDRLGVLTMQGGAA
jgi:hypothetical protein